MTDCMMLDELTPEEKLKTTLELMVAGIAMKRESLLRKFPNEDQATISGRLQAWLERRSYETGVTGDES